MLSKKISVNRSKNNSSLIENETYDHYLAIDWSGNNMAIASMGRKDLEPKVIDLPSDLGELKLYLTKLTGKKILR